MLVPVKYLEDLINPLQDPPWMNVDSSISKKEIIDIAKLNLKKPKIFDPFKAHKETKRDHLERIAYYFKYGWGETPILLLLKEDPKWCPLVDGFHRLCAAICRDDDMIQAEVRGERHLIRKIYEFEEKLLCSNN